jgi:hypothetical protein
MLMEKIDQYVFSKCVGNKAAIFLDIHGSKKLMLNLNVDFKNFILSKPIICMDKDDFEKVEHRERWPLPDDLDKLLINKNTKSLPKKRAIPLYTISLEEIDFDDYNSNLRSGDIDSYELNPEVNQELYELFNKSEADIKSPKKKYYEIYPYTENKNLKKAFGVLKITSVSSVNNNSVSMRIKLYILPFNYSEFFNIIFNYEKVKLFNLQNVINKTEFIIRIEKYMIAIPFYYKPYIVNYLENRGLWTTESNFTKKLYEENVNETILSQIKLLCQEESKRLSTINSIYEQNKASHSEHTASCCKIGLISQSNNQVKGGDKNKDINELLNAIIDINSSIRKCHLNNKEVERRSINDNVEIDSMGDYREYLDAHKPLRLPYLSDEEVNKFRGDYFGNPFRRSKLDLSQSNINLDNISLTDGEKTILEDEVSVVGNKKYKKMSFGSLDDNLFNNTVNTMDVDVKSETTGIINSNIVFDLKNNPSLIEDNLTEDFKEMFNKDLPEQIHPHSGLKIIIPMKVEIKSLYDYKFTESLKEG